MVTKSNPYNKHGVPTGDKYPYLGIVSQGQDEPTKFIVESPHGNLSCYNGKCQVVYHDYSLIKVSTPSYRSPDPGDRVICHRRSSDGTVFVWWRLNGFVEAYTCLLSKESNSIPRRLRRLEKSGNLDSLTVALAHIRLTNNLPRHVSLQVRTMTASTLDRQANTWEVDRETWLYATVGDDPRFPILFQAEPARQVKGRGLTLRPHPQDRLINQLEKGDFSPDSVIAVIEARKTHANEMTITIWIRKH